MDQAEQRRESLRAAADRARENARQLIDTTGELIDTSHRLLDRRPGAARAREDASACGERRDDGDARA